MTLQKAAELIHIYLTKEAPYHYNDFEEALATFIPLIDAAAYTESQNQTPIVLPVQKGESP